MEMHIHGALWVTRLLGLITAISSLSKISVSSKILPVVPAIQGRLLRFTVPDKERGIADAGTLGAASRLTPSQPGCVWLFPAVFGWLVLRQMLM